MLLTIQWLLLVFTASTRSEYYIPEAPDTAVQEVGPVDLFEHVILDHESLKKRDAAPLPRDFLSAEPPLPNLTPPSSPAMVKRILQGRQRTCDAGFSFCRSLLPYALLLSPLLIMVYITNIHLDSGRCCPDTNGGGRCCKDGTCVTSSDTCCTGGEACPSGQDCCRNGCKLESSTCCSDNYSCRSGYKCCGNQSCAPIGGECCSGGRSCAKGLRCVVLRGVRGCCRDLACSEFDNDIDDGGSDGTTRSISIPSISIPSISIPSFSISSIGSITIPPISIPTFSAPVGVSFSYYTTTITWYYYTFFITTLATTTTPTSTRTSTTTTLSVYASARADANSIFRSLTSAVDFPSSVTAADYNTNFTASSSTEGATSTAIASATGGSAATGGSNAGGGGASKAAKMGGEMSLGVLVMVVVGLGSGVAMMLL